MAELMKDNIRQGIKKELGGIGCKYFGFIIL